LFLAFQHFQDKDKDKKLPVELIGLSGTSGGAITAAMAWSDPGGVSDPWAEGARRVLDFWQRNKAISGFDNPDPLWWFEGSSNWWGQWFASFGNLIPKTEWPVSPLLSDKVKERMRGDISDAAKTQGRTTIKGRPGMALYVGACDIVNEAGRPDSAFTAFPLPGQDLTLSQLLASAAIPELFDAEEIRINRVNHYFWDGLYSQNPPINNFFSGKDKQDKPDLLWVIQINPSRYQPSAGENQPQTPLQVQDRRNELIGNLSLGHELNTIETLNGLYMEPPEGLQDHKRVTYSLIPLDLLDGRPLDYASKMNRAPAFIDELIRLGARTAYQCAKEGKLMTPT
jgi:NTE family protein